MAAPVAKATLVSASAAKDVTPRTVTYNAAVGDRLVAKYGIETSGVDFTPPSDTQGLTWTLRARVNVTGSNAQIAIYTSSPVVTAGSITVTVGPTGTSDRWTDLVVVPYSGASFANNPAVYTGTGVGAPSGVLATVGTDSVIAIGVVDWNAADISGRAWRSGATEERAARTSGYSSFYAQQAAAAPGDKTIGLSAPSNLAWSMAALEVMAPGANVPPAADAGADRTVEPYAEVTLTGAGSDADGTITGFTWTQTAGPAVDLAGAGAVRTFIAPAVSGGTTLTFQLVVTDNAGATSPADTITITVPDPGNYRASGSSWVPYEIRQL